MIIPLHSINDRNISLPNFDTIIKGSEVVPIDLLSSHCLLSIQFYRKVPRARKLPTVLRNQYCIVANGKCQSRYYSFRLKALFHYCIDFIPSLCFSCWLHFLPTLPIYFVMCGGTCLLYFPNIDCEGARIKGFFDKTTLDKYTDKMMQMQYLPPYSRSNISLIQQSDDWVGGILTKNIKKLFLQKLLAKKDSVFPLL